MRNRTSRLVGIVGTMLFAGATLATKTRGAIAATLLGGLALVWMHPNKRIRRLTIMAALLALVALLLGLFDSAVRAFLLRDQSSDQLLTLTGRTGLAEGAWPTIADHWLFGSGYLAARSLFLDIAFGAGESHNLWLEVVVSTGIIGLVVVLALLARLLRAQRHALRRLPERLRGFARESVALLVFLLVSGIVTDGFAGATGTDTVALMWSALLVTMAARPATASTPPDDPSTTLK
jgi:O-antigen ligase